MKSFTMNVNKTNTIQLHRFVRLDGRSDSQVFTFIIPSQLTRGFINNAQSKDFCYGGQTWNLHLCYQRDSMSISESAAESIGTTASQNIVTNPLNIGLSLCGGLTGMRCKLEFIRFTVINRDNFNANKSHEEIQTLFTSDAPSVWKKEWIKLDTLAPECFLFDDWTWLLEIELRGACTVYEEFLSIPKTTKDAIRRLNLESASFTYAGSDWSVSLEWQASDLKKQSVPSLTKTKTETNVCPLLKLHRHSRTNHWCRVRYMATLSLGDRNEFSVGPINQLITSDNGATTSGQEIGDPKWFANIAQGAPFNSKTKLKISIEMLVAAPVSRIDLIPIAPQGGKNVARCKDPEGHDWLVVSDIFGTLVRLRFFPIVEVHHHDGMNTMTQAVEKPNELRCVAWNVHLIPHDTSKGVIKALSSPYTSYVPLFRCLMQHQMENQCSDELSNVQQLMIHPDEVTEVALDLPVEKVCDASAGYIRTSDNAMTIRIEWLQSQRLSQGNYSVYDDVFQIQRKQLSKELRTLQQENYNLEKQLMLNSVQVSTNISSGDQNSSLPRNQSWNHLSVSPDYSRRKTIANRSEIFKIAHSQNTTPAHRRNQNHLQLPEDSSSVGAGGRRHSSFMGTTETIKLGRTLPSPAGSKLEYYNVKENEAGGYSSRDDVGPANRKIFQKYVCSNRCSPTRRMSQLSDISKKSSSSDVKKF